MPNRLPNALRSSTDPRESSPLCNFKANGIQLLTLGVKGSHEVKLIASLKCCVISKLVYLLALFQGVLQGSVFVKLVYLHQRLILRDWGPKDIANSLDDTLPAHI